MRFRLRFVVRLVLPGVCLSPGSVATALGSDGSLSRVGSLSAPAGATLSDVAVSAGTVVASADPVGYVFTEPATGWSNETPVAELTDSQGAVASVSVDGPTIVTGEGSLNGVTANLAVFVEPPGGWSGTLAPSARLTSSDHVLLGPASISGSTIVADGQDTTKPESYSVYVFTRPAGGWSGTISEQAKLADSQGLTLYDAVISGQTIFAIASTGHCCGTRVDAFTEPAGGWSGIVHQSATLPAVGRLAVSGNAVLVSGRLPVPGKGMLSGGVIFTEPARGWKGVVQPVGQLILGDQQAQIGPLWQSFSNDVAAMNTYALGAEHDCPCQVQIWAFTLPPGGWSGTYFAPPVLGDVSGQGVMPLAVDQRSLFTGDGTNQLTAYAVSGQLGWHAAPPTVSRASLSGLAKHRPRLGLTVAAKNPFPAIDSLTITLPHGLSFTGARKLLRAGVRIGGVADATLSISHGKLEIRWPDSANPISLSVRAPALRESTPLLRRAARPARQTHRKSQTTRTLRLRLILTAADSVNDTYRLVLKLHAT